MEEKLWAAVAGTLANMAILDTRGQGYYLLNVDDLAFR